MKKLCGEKGGIPEDRDVLEGCGEEGKGQWYEMKGTLYCDIASL